MLGRRNNVGYEESQVLSHNELLLSMINAKPSGSNINSSEDIKKEIKEEVDDDEDYEMPVRVAEDNSLTEYCTIKDEDLKDENPASPINAEECLGKMVDYRSPSHYRTLGSKFVFVKRPNSSMRIIHRPGGPIAFRFKNAPDNLELLNPTLATALKSLPGVRIEASTARKSYSILPPKERSDPVSVKGGSPGSSEKLYKIVGTVPSKTVDVDGQQRNVPEEIPCHRCGYHMRISQRRSKYRDELKVYAAYRCLKKGCQTFKSVSKVLNPINDSPSKKRRSLPDMPLHKVPRLQEESPQFPVTHQQSDVAFRFPVTRLVLPTRVIEEKEVKEEE